MKTKWIYVIFITFLGLILNIGTSNISINANIIGNTFFIGYLAYQIWTNYENKMKNE